VRGELRFLVSSCENRSSYVAVLLAVGIPEMWHCVEREGIRFLRKRYVKRKGVVCVILFSSLSGQYSGMWHCVEREGTRLLRNVGI
jgi:hypothetical protein